MPRKNTAQNLGILAKAVVNEKLKTGIVPFVLPQDSPNLWIGAVY